MIKIITTTVWLSSILRMIQKQKGCMLQFNWYILFFILVSLVMFTYILCYIICWAVYHEYAYNLMTQNFIINCTLCSTRRKIVNIKQIKELKSYNDQVLWQQECILEYNWHNITKLQGKFTNNTVASTSEYSIANWIFVILQKIE